MNGTCPWCQTVVKYVVERGPYSVGKTASGELDLVSLSETRTPFDLVLEVRRCPACERLVVLLQHQLVKSYTATSGAGPRVPTFTAMGDDAIVHPASAYGRPAQPEVPLELAEDYQEARAVLKASPKAAAALARRALQNLIRSTLGHERRTLYQEIEAVLGDASLPTPIAEQLHAIREIGNLGAHPMREEATGAVVAVEPEEAQWLVDVLYDLFDHCFVKPAATKSRLASMNAKIDLLTKASDSSPAPSTSPRKP